MSIISVKSDDQSVWKREFLEPLLEALGQDIFHALESYFDV